jgi:hypothetical protein
MNARWWVGAGLLLSCAASDPGSADDTDGGSPIARGTVGSHVWFDSSTGIELRNVWAYNGSLAGMPPVTGSTCWTFERNALDDAQLAALEDMILVPLTEACTADGYSYYELTVVDADGTRAAYRDTGCSYLRLEGATAMLPQNLFLSNVLSGEGAILCP